MRRSEMDNFQSAIRNRILAGFWRAAMEPSTVFRALKVAMFVGTVLTLINQGEIILGGHMPPLWKLLLTYLVPYCVSTHSAASHQLILEKLQANQ